ncbi:hypothetical protein EJB05_14801, partial [Eragrostis curvula]
MSSCRTALMTAVGGGLGSAVVRGSQLYVWSRETGSHGDMIWVTKRVIELKVLIPVTLDVVSSADGDGVVYVGTRRHGSFFVDLKTGWFRKGQEVNGADNIVPYMSFYTPALGVASTSEDARDCTLRAWRKKLKLRVKVFG